MSISIPLRPGKLLQTAMHELETGSPSKSHKRRWRLAFMAISFTRALRFLAKNVHENKAILLRSLSYVAIDVQPSADADDKPAGNVDPKDLADIVRAKNLGALMSQYGGLERLVKTLETDVKNGINSTESDLMRRKNIFGANEYQKQPVKGFLPSVFDALLKIVIIVVLGMKQPGSQDQGWFDVDGMSIILVVSILLAFSAASNFRRSRALAQKLSRNSSSSSDMSVNVTRNGQALTISIFDVVVGDVVNLKIGDQIPADGLFSEGHSLKVDESCLTGESDHVEINAASNPFMLSGTKVVGGAGTMVVTSVGMNTAWGEKMSSVVLCGDDDEVTPLQTRLKQLTSFIQKVGLYVTALILVSSMVCYIIRHKTVENGCGQKEYGVGSSKNKFDDVINSVVGIVAAAMAIIVVGIPDGLHLAVTLTEVYSMRRMMKDYAVVRNLTACETMGSTTMVCITLNEMKVTEVWLGKEPLYEDGTIISLLRESIGLNTAGGVYKPTPDTTPEKSGSPIDKAMMSWAVFSLGLDIDELKARCEIIQVEASNSEKKMSGVLFRRKHKRTLHECHWKGAAEIVLAKCSNYYDRDGVIRPINKEERKCIETNIQNMAAKGLRCIAFAHKKIEREQGQINSEKMEESGLTLLALAGLTNPCGPGVKVVVDTCIAAGVGIKMVTDDDNVHTARAMAVECGILKPEHDDVLESREAVIEGVQFRNLSPEEEKRKVEKIRVMARSSPFDKRLMVESLKRKSDPHVVAFIGDGRNDAPALKEAHVGISMGLFQGPEVANEISDILILNDNINSVVTILKWGRCVYENIQKFIQFLLTMNLAALIFTFVVSLSHDKVPLTAVQLLWVNLIMDIFAALALATEKPAKELMKKPPVGRKEPLITRIMWRNLIAHALFQVTVLVTLQFKGRSIFGVNEKVKNALIFNTFVQCQVFNEFNARKLETKNIFKGIRKNRLFLGIVGITILFQVLTMEFLNKFASNERLNWGQWGASVGIATLSWPIGWIVKCIPVSGNRVMTRYQDLLAKKF